MRIVFSHNVGFFARFVFPIVVDDLAVLVNLGTKGGYLGVFHLIVDVRIVLILFQRGSVSNLNDRIQNLPTSFILISLDIVKLFHRDDLVLTEAYTVIGVVTVGIVGAVFADFILAVLDDFSARLGGKSVVFQIADIVGFLYSAAIPEADIAVRKQIGLGGHVSIHHIVVGRLEGGKEGCQDGEEHQNGNNHAADNRAFVLAEAAERTLEIAYGLRLEFAVMIQIVSGSKLELFRGDIIKIIIHNYLAPILILGSMKP